MQTKDFQFKVEAFDDEAGTFEGFLSVYNLVDYGNDLVEPGAFEKTIKEKPTVPMLWQHDEKQPIGLLELQDNPKGLWVKGKFLLEIDKAREAYALVKAGVIRGLSIGYRAVQKQTVKGVRHLKEVMLFEGSVVTFPMNAAAQIATVKAMLDGERKADFLAELEEIRLRTLGWMMMDALHSALYDNLFDSEMDAAGKLEASGASIDQFRAAYMEYLPQYLAMVGEMGAEENDAKAGRRISAASRSQIEEAILKLQALLVDDDSTSTEDVVMPEAAKSADEPDALNLHSWLQSFSEELKAAA